jgi:WD40 repeat protein
VLLGSKTRRTDGTVKALAISADGAWLAFGGDRVELHDLRSDRHACTLPAYASDLAIAPDGSRIWTAGVALACFDGRGAKVWSRDDAGHVARLFWPRPSGKPILASVRSRAGAEALLLLRPEDGAIVTEIGTSGRPRSVAFTPDGRFLVFAVRGERARILSVATGKVVAELAGTVGATFVAASHERIVVASEELRAFPVPGEPGAAATLAPLGGTWGDHPVAFSPDGTLLARTHVGGVTVLDLRRATARTLALPGIAGSLAFHPDGWVLAVGNGNAVRLVDVASMRDLDAGDGHQARVYALAAARTRVVSGGRETLFCADLSSGRRRDLAGHEDALEGAALSADGAVAATVAADGKLCLWDTETGTLRRSIDAHAGLFASGVALSPAGDLAVTSDDRGELRAWRCPSGESAWTWRAPNYRVGAESRVAWVGEHHVCVVCGADEDRVAVLVDARSGDAVRTLPGPWSELVGGNAAGAFALLRHREVHVHHLDSRSPLVREVSGIPSAVALSPRLVAVGLYQGHVDVFEWETGLSWAMRWVPGDDERVTALAFLDDTRLAVGFALGHTMVVEVPPPSANEPAAPPATFDSSGLAAEIGRILDGVAPTAERIGGGYRSAPSAAHRDADGLGAVVQAGERAMRLRIEPDARSETILVRVRPVDAPERASSSGVFPDLAARARRWVASRDEVEEARRALLAGAHEGEVEIDGSTVTVRLRALPSPEWLARAVAFAATRA